MRITVIGSGHTGLAEAALMSTSNEVKILKTGDINDSVLVEATEAGIIDLQQCILTDVEQAVKDAEMVFISVAAPYDTELNMYDTHDVDMYINQVLRYSPDATVVLRSDVPVGYTKRVMSRYPGLNIMFVPDFAREGRAIKDSFNPARVIIGGGSDSEKELVASLLVRDCEVVYTDTDEAESVKLFANAYLAMRVAYFNELDTYAELKGLKSQDIIRSVSLDPRVGDLYNNPSFGYGGKYLVEGTCRLRNDFADIPERMVDMVEASNEVRKQHVVDMIMAREPKTVGIYGLSMKTGSKDFRYSAVDGVIRKLQAKGVHVIIFEPMLDMERFLSADVEDDFHKFAGMSDVIVANRVDDNVKKYADKVYTRDLFERD